MRAKGRGFNYWRASRGPRPPGSIGEASTYGNIHCEFQTVRRKTIFEMTRREVVGKDLDPVMLHYIGKVIDALKATGQYDNTLIVFTSDNGGHLPSLANNGPTRDGKQSMYEGGLRVPAAIVWPGKIKPGTVSDQVNLTMDIFPTLLEVAGTQPVPSIEGRSFLPTLLIDLTSVALHLLFSSCQSIHATMNR